LLIPVVMTGDRLHEVQLRNARMLLSIAIVSLVVVAMIVFVPVEMTPTRILLVIAAAASGALSVVRAIQVRARIRRKVTS
jgi:hypothetical protein